MPAPLGYQLGPWRAKGLVGSRVSVCTQIWYRTSFTVDSVLRHCAERERDKEAPFSVAKCRSPNITHLWWLAAHHIFHISRIKVKKLQNQTHNSFKETIKSTKLSTRKNKSVTESDCHLFQHALLMWYYFVIHLLLQEGFEPLTYSRNPNSVYTADGHCRLNDVASNDQFLSVTHKQRPSIMLLQYLTSCSNHTRTFTYLLSKITARIQRASALPFSTLDTLTFQWRWSLTSKYIPRRRCLNLKYS
jgi:hypothetical protein